MLSNCQRHPFMRWLLLLVVLLNAQLYFPSDSPRGTRVAGVSGVSVGDNRGFADSPLTSSTSNRYLGHHSRYCPATSTLHFDVDAYFPYPMDLFDPVTLKLYQSHLPEHHTTSDNASTHLPGSHLGHGNSKHRHAGHHFYQHMEDKLYNCTSELGKIFNREDTAHPKHVCSPYLPMTCPLIEENAADAMAKAHTWMYPHQPPSKAYQPHLRTSTISPKHMSPTTSDAIMQELRENMPFLYHVWQDLFDPSKTIRLFILGGSAAEGAGSQGCVCDPKYEQKCQGFQHVAFATLRTFPLPGHCRWGNFFAKWLQGVALAKVQVDFYTKGGTDIIFASQTFFAYFHENYDTPQQRAQLTHSDIVLLDYSMNDGLTHFKINQIYHLESGMEWFMRQVHINSNPNAAPPTVVLLENYPFAGHSKKQPYVDGNIPLVDYANSYEKIAKHYHIPIISVRDLLWSNATLTKQASIHKHMLMLDHPLWFQQYLLADLYATVFAQELHEAKIFQHYMQVLKAAKLIPSNAFYDPVCPPLPQALHREEVTSLCDPNVKPLLDLTAADLHPPAASSALSAKKYARIGHTEVSLSSYNEHDPLSSEQRKEWFAKLQAASSEVGVAANSMWRLEEDRPGKVGWIDNYVNISTRFPNIPIRAMDHSITFHFDDPNNDFYAYPHLIHIQYLKTYKNGGRMELHICGMNMDRHDILDALYPDPNTHLSVTQIFSKITNSVSKDLCLHQRNRSANHDTLKNTSFLEFVHAPVEICLGPPREYSPAEWPHVKQCKGRTSEQKVKIMSVKVCRLALQKFEGTV